MISGAHVILYSKDAEADRAFLRDVIGLNGVDAGQSWLIFGLPPSEIAVHPGERNDVHEVYFMCDDVVAFVAKMKGHGIACGPLLDRGWGILTELRLPGGGKLGVYQPRHPRPSSAKAPRARAAKPSQARTSSPSTRAKVSPKSRTRSKAKPQRRPL